MELRAPPVDLMAQTNPTLAKARELGALAASRDARDRARIASAAEEFEAVFLGQMLQPMFETVEVDELFGGGSGEQMFRSMMVQEYGRALARSGGVGIADAVKQQLLTLQEVER